MALELLTPASGISVALAMALAVAAIKVARMFDAISKRGVDIEEDQAALLSRLNAVEAWQGERDLAAARKEGARAERERASGKSGAWDGAKK